MHTLVVEVLDDADPPHVGVRETAVFVEPCNIACQLAQAVNPLLAGLSLGLIAVGVVVYWLLLIYENIDWNNNLAGMRAVLDAYGN